MIRYNYDFENLSMKCHFLKIKGIYSIILLLEEHTLWKKNSLWIKMESLGFQIDNVRFRELSKEQVFGVMKEPLMRM